MRLRNLINGVVIAATASSLFASGGLAQTVPTRTFSNSIDNVADAFDRAFFNKSGDLYFNSSLGRQFEFVFNFGDFPDRQIVEDARLVENLYRDFLQQQTTSDPYLRTPDLANPYNSSLLLNSAIPTPIYTTPAPLPAPEVPPPVEPPVPEIPRALY